MINRTFVLALAGLVLVLAAACSGGGGGTKVSTQVVPPGAKVTPNAVTGLGELDALIFAAVGANNIELAALTGYQKLACKTAPTPGELAPACREGESDGTSVEVLPSSGGACERNFVRPEQVPDAFRTAFPSKDTAVFAVYRPKPDPASFGGGFSSGQVIVFRTGAHPNTAPMGVAVHVKDGRVVWLEADCDNVFTLVASERVDSFILDPEGVVTKATPSPAATTSATTVPVIPGVPPPTEAPPVP